MSDVKRYYLCHIDMEYSAMAEVGSEKASFDVSDYDHFVLDTAYDAVVAERDSLLVAIERWKIEELRQLQCQCVRPNSGILGTTQWCFACERPEKWEDALKKMRPDERALIERPTASAGV